MNLGTLGSRNPDVGLGDEAAERSLGLRNVLTETVYMTDSQKTFAKGAKMKVETKPKVDHTPAEMDEASLALLRAAAFLEESGLWGVQHCAWTAINCSAHGITKMEASARMFKALGADNVGGIFRWNDTVGRTQDEVVAKLRAVALGL